MNLHIISPYSLDKNLGKAYNEAMQLIPEDDYACITDIDVQFLLPEQPRHIYEYIKRYPNAGMFTCLTNRISALSTQQLYAGVVSEETNMNYHIAIARACENNLYSIDVIQRDISGFLMVISKKQWNERKFPDNGACLLVDTHFGRNLRATGKQILVMKGIYVFHQYRMEFGVREKKHLQP